MELPRAAVVEERPTGTASGERRPSTTPPATGRSVLIVEDHEDTAELLALMLESHGYHVERASTVAEARALASRDWNILVCDLGLPDGSGLDIVRALSAERRKDVRAIALSGYGSPEDRRRSREAGFVEHLTKPVDAVTLVEAIEAVAVRRAS